MPARSEAAMAKSRKSLTFELPAHQTPRQKWRRAIRRYAERARRRAHLRYTESDKVQLQVRIYLTHGVAAIHDVDNRLKDIMDALQGRISGPKRRPPRSPIIIANDNQIWRVLVEKDDADHHKGRSGKVKIMRWRRKP